MKKIKVISPKFVEIEHEQIPIGRQYKTDFFEAVEKLNFLGKINPFNILVIFISYLNTLTSFS